MDDLSFVHYRNFQFDGLLFVRCVGADLGKVKSIRYVLRSVIDGRPRRLEDRTVTGQASSGQLEDYGCPATFSVAVSAGTYSVTPTVTWLDGTGERTQAFAALMFDIKATEATRRLLDNVPLEPVLSRRERSIENKAHNLPVLEDEALQGHPEINSGPVLGPLLLAFAEGGAERFAADMEPSSGSHLAKLWPKLGEVIKWQPVLDADERDDQALAVLAPYYCIEQPDSMLNDTFVALGRTLASLDYVLSVQLLPKRAESPAWALAAAGFLATLFTGGAVVLGNRANENARPTPDYEALQTYLDEPGTTTKGLNIRKAWERKVTGKGIRTHLTDGGLNKDHEDLPGVAQIHVVEAGPNDDPVHGTAAAGLLVAKANGFGTTGIAHGAQLYVYHNRSANSQTLKALLRLVLPGDVVAFNREVEATGMPGTRLPTLHSELWWQVIRDLNARGAVVVCAAGNGHMADNAAVGAVKGRGVDLSAWRYFDNHGDAGAIVVGACQSWSGKPSEWSNFHYPYRMLNSWGDGVVTLGALHDSDLQDKSGTDRDYTDFYNGTSAATPMVAGALSLIQSYAIERHHVYLNGDQMHLLVMKSGYEDATLPGETRLPMGGRPNVEGAMALLDALLVSGQPGKDEL
ncbi:S8 family serine peptidase [Pseudomonas sichuanensis]|uniref:S8 family serine peptidase n=1 Tax=Pseudomonas sichuanensis TaxID=2213015 RepID=UPI002447D714|nr:S8 family serine peptidase [Pseudomonas sichuanensis]MDH0733555.1 S8 family serine peptidase [Pseudomonas sichuanensis]MDH1585599.1 S8 family serine peptidase [Pseudomonas sichuanensis]MDH1595394.1 S8 family serine peptidase [Pseudomonas sichuanensis]MDH1600842.1 S8 family serine peptidase [Pseudomonas sichuanensis]